jgi:acetate kinase
VDRAANEAAIGVSAGEARRISPANAALAAYVVGVDEERMIAGETMRVMVRA